MPPSARPWLPLARPLLDALAAAPCLLALKRALPPGLAGLAHGLGSVPATVTGPSVQAACARLRHVTSIAIYGGIPVCTWRGRPVPRLARGCAGVTLDSYQATVVLGGAQVLAGAGASFSLARLGRRPLAIGACAAQTVPLLALAVYLHVGEDHAPSLPLAMLVLYVVAGAFGLHTLPWAMVGEAYLPLEGALERSSARGGVEGVFYTSPPLRAQRRLRLLWLPETPRPHRRRRSRLRFARAPARRPAPPRPPRPP
ncbi:uncharacterized protein GBIM_12178 [Gryllus bimaculatus]|nr:uncharacterized protein GBIM_12178 [Gryllus bimaculatus]